MIRALIAKIAVALSMYVICARAIPAIIFFAIFAYAFFFYVGRVADIAMYHSPKSFSFFSLSIASLSTISTILLCPSSASSYV